MSIEVDNNRDTDLLSNMSVVYLLTLLMWHIEAESLFYGVELQFTFFDVLIFKKSVLKHFEKMLIKRQEKNDGQERFYLNVLCIFLLAIKS